MVGIFELERAGPGPGPGPPTIVIALGYLADPRPGNVGGVRGDIRFPETGGGGQGKGRRKEEGGRRKEEEGKATLWVLGNS